ncbi:MAG: Nitrogen-fixing NifU domain protein [Parcubacteria group bacterium GW2011_GWA2_46_9]|nr:MAG: Nitrogen-fixing NifU domain protein [Parcubacteria group bacterium GW2011_GWA2_46_9]
MNSASVKSTEIGTADVRDHKGRGWVYSDTVKEHFFNPRNLMLEEVDETEYNAVGRVGSPACGDEMKMWLKVDLSADKIIECKWRTFGCGSAIAATSMLSVMVTENSGMQTEAALKITPRDIMERLDGLPNRKIHCSVLGDKALRAALNYYFRNSGQFHRVIVEGARVIDSQTNVTDRDIEEAVLDGADTLEKVQQKTKAGIGNPDVVAEVEQLIRFYKEKYYG